MKRILLINQISFLIFISLNIKYSSAQNQKYTSPSNESIIGFDQISGNKLARDKESGRWFLIGTGKVKNFDVTNLINKYEDYKGFDFNITEGISTDASLFIDKEGRWKATGIIGGAAFLKHTQAEGFTSDENYPTPLMLLFNKGYKLTVTMEKGAEALLREKKVRSIENTTFILLDGDDSEFNSRISEGTLKIIKDVSSKSEIKNKDISLLPSYSEVIKNYPKGVKLTWTKAQINGYENGIFVLHSDSGIEVRDNQMMVLEYGVKLTVKQKIVVDGVTYMPGDKLTVDKNKKLIKVKSWE